MKSVEIFCFAMLLSQKFTYSVCSENFVGLLLNTSITIHQL